MELKQLISYWKQIRAGLLETMGRFTDEDLSYVPCAGGWSVGEIMLHIAHEERGEIQYGVTGELSEWPADEYRLEDYPSKESIAELLTRVHNHTEEYLRTLDDSDLNREIEAPWGKVYPLRAMTWHVMEHEIHHRGELSLILGMLGREGLDA